MKNSYTVRYYLIIPILLLSVILQGQDCVISKEVKRDYDRLFRLVSMEFPHQALSLADSLLTTLEAEKKTKCITYYWVQYKKGYVLDLFNRNEEALTVFYTLIRDAKSTNHWEIVANGYISIAKTHEIIGRPKDCLRNLEKALQIIEKHKLNAVFSRYAVRYASYHRIYDNVDSTKVYAQKAIEFGTKYNVFKSITDGHLLTGMVTDDLEKSIYHFQAAADLFFKQKMYLAAASQKGNIAKIYLLEKELPKAMLHLDTAYTYILLTPKIYPQYFTGLERIYDIRASVFEAQGMMDSAFYYLKKNQEAAKEQIYRTNQENINQKEIAFAIEQEQEELKFERQRTKTLIWFSLLLLLLLIVGILGFLDNRRKGKEINKKNEALNELLKFQSVLLSEIHHRVKNNLQLVISLLTIRSYKTKDESMKTQLNDISNKVRSIALIHEQLYQTEVFEKINIQNYLNQLFAYFKTLDATDNSFTFDVNTNNIELNLETIVPLGIVCSELISNSLKHAQQPDKILNISIVLEKNETLFKLQYQDNGIGYPNERLEQRTNSVGTLLIKSMVRQLLADYQIFNQNGAVLVLSFKEKKISNV